MEDKEILKMIQELTKKEISISQVSDEMSMNQLEVLGMIGILREKGINIAIRKKDDDIYLFNHGERELSKSNKYEFHTDENNEFKFVAISYTRIG